MNIQHQCQNTIAAIVNIAFWTVVLGQIEDCTALLLKIQSDKKTGVTNMKKKYSHEHSPYIIMVIENAMCPTCFSLPNFECKTPKGHISVFTHEKRLMMASEMGIKVP